MKIVALCGAFSAVVILETVISKERNCTEYVMCSFNKERNVPICNCDQECVNYKDCCVDLAKVLMLTGLPKKERERRRRITTSVCEFLPEDNILGVKVVSTCTTDRNLICDQADDYSESTDIVYVTGSDGLTYKNRRCALCNGITSFQIWSLQLIFTRSFIPSIGKNRCRSSVFDNVSEMSQFEMAIFLIKNCKHRFIPPSGVVPRLCVHESYKCSAARLGDENPFDIAQSSDPLTMMALFTFDEKPDGHGEKDTEVKDSDERTMYSTDLVLSSRILSRRFWLYCNSLLTMDQLFKLVDSLYLFFTTAVSDVKFVDPFFIDYIIIDAKDVRIQIFVFVESVDFIKLSTYTIIKKWLDNVIISYQDTYALNDSSYFTYKVVSTSPLERTQSGNDSYKVARLRYYIDYIYLDAGMDLLGTKLRTYNGKHKEDDENTYPSAMCQEIYISYITIENKTIFENDCVIQHSQVDEATQHSHGSQPCFTMMTMLVLFVHNLLNAIH